MARATMPEATIQKDGDSLFWKSYVRGACQSPMPAPANDFFRPQDLYELPLGCLIAIGSNARHDFGSLGRIKNVYHKNTMASTLTRWQ